MFGPNVATRRNIVLVDFVQDYQNNFYPKKMRYRRIDLVMNSMTKENVFGKTFDVS